MTQPSEQVLQVLLRRLAVLDIIGRTKAKAARGAELRRWALGVTENLIDPASSLALDDENFVPEYARGIVSSTAVYPTMIAIDSIIAIAELVDDRDGSRRHLGSGMGHAAALLTLCRMATESAARTIWLLSSPERAVRRSASVRFSLSEMNEQRSVHQTSRIWFEVGGGKNMRGEYEKFLEQVRRFEDRISVFARARQGTPRMSVLDNRALIEAAGHWLDENPPCHVPDGPFGRVGFGFEQAAATFYVATSGIVHGLKWLTDWMPSGEPDLYRLVHESYSGAVSMAECAVALFEAQARDWHHESERPRLYPEYLQPTIDQWAALYPVDPA